MIVYFFYTVHEICSILKKVLSVLFSKVVYLNVLTIIIFFVGHARIGLSKNSDLYLPYLCSFICLSYCMLC